jgi:putative glutamine amidotransferase
MGEGLRPLAWAEDGVVEAVEHITHPWCIGVQWHPEMQLDEAVQPRLFAALVTAARVGTT